MAAAKLQLNWTGVTFASTSIAHVSSVMFGQGGELINFAGDNARYPQIIANNVSRPRCSITSGDIYTIMNFTTGQSGTISAVQKDAASGINGDITWTLSGAVHENSQQTGQWGQFASATATFQAYASDGSTNPLSIAQA